jgi:hypothetical protein
VTLDLLFIHTTRSALVLALAEPALASDSDTEMSHMPRSFTIQMSRYVLSDKVVFD